MKVDYFPDTDTLYIALVDRPGVDVLEAAPDIRLDIDENEEVVGVEIEHASHNVDLSSVQLSSWLAGHKPTTVTE